MKLLIDLDNDCCSLCKYQDYFTRTCRLFRDRDGGPAALRVGKDGAILRCRQCREAERKAQR